MSEDELPEGWLLAALTDICDINPRRPDLAHLDPNASVTFVPMPAVDAQRGAITNAVLRPLVEVRKGFTSFRDDDVIMAKITPCMENGKAAIARGLANGLGFGSTEFHVLRSYGAVLPEYVYHFVRQDSFRAAAAAEMTGSVGQKRVPASFLEGTSIPLPPLAEQKRIVAKIEELLAGVSAARERLAKVPAILKRFRQAVLAAAFSGRLTADWREQHPGVPSSAELVRQLAQKRRALWVQREIAKHASRGRAADAELVERRYRERFRPSGIENLPVTWTPAAVADVSFLDVGNAFQSTDFSTSGIRLLRGENIEPGALRWKDTRFWPNKQLNGFERLLIEPGEIILAMDRPVISSGLKLARATDADLPCLLVQRMTRFKMIEPTLTGFLYHCLQRADFIEHLSRGLTGSDLPHITGDCVADYSFGLPPLAEAVEIVRRVESLFRCIGMIAQRVCTASNSAGRIVAATLRKAFRGELVPTESDLARQERREYEPASVLLDRIRSERASPGNDAPRSRRKPRDSMAGINVAAADNQSVVREDADEVARADQAIDSIERKSARAANPGKTKRGDQTSVAATPAPIDQTDRNEVLAVIRQVFSDGEPRDRATAIRDIAHALGYRRTGARIQEILNADLLTAVRRGVLENERGELRLLCRSADDYTLDHRVEMLLAAMGTGWQTRDEAITAAARHLGFRRTGPALRAAFKSAINAALRRNQIERGDTQHIRRTR